MDANERAIFEALVVTHQAALCAIAYAVLRDRARSEEVAQDALLVAWRERETAVLTPGWLCAVARNLARNAARRRREVPMEREPAAATRDVRDAMIAREDAAAANVALARLPDKYRDALCVYVRSDESYAHVAAALGITEEAARQRVSRGRARLRDRFAAVEAALRATRPGAAFTAAVVGAWLAGKAAPAHAMSRPPAPAWLAPAIGVGAVASLLAIGVAVRAATAAAPVERATPPAGSMSESEGLAAMAAMAARSHAHGSQSLSRPGPVPTLPATRRALPATKPLPPPAEPLFDGDLRDVPASMFCMMVALRAKVPIFYAGDPAASLTINGEGVPIFDALDRGLAMIHAHRETVGGIDLVPVAQGGLTDAATLGGALMTVHYRARSLPRVLNDIEPALGLPMLRSLDEFAQMDTGSDGNLHPIREFPTITLDLEDAPAGLVLQQTLAQFGYGYTPVTGLLVTPD